MMFNSKDEVNSLNIEPPFIASQFQLILMSKVKILHIFLLEAMNHVVLSFERFFLILV